MKASSAAWKTAGGNLGGNMGLAILLAAMLQAAAADPTQKVYDVEFAPLAPSERQYAHLGPVGPYYPDRAFRVHQSGEALLRCTVGGDGVLQHCLAVAETPDRSGFAEAALILAYRGRVKAGGAPPDGASIVVRVPFTIGAPATVIEHAARAPTLKVPASEVRGHAEVSCFVGVQRLERCYVLYFRFSNISRPTTDDARAAERTAMINSAAAALAATAQVSPAGLAQNGWIVIPMDITPSAASKP